MSAGLNTFGMIAGLGKAFDDGYETAEKARQEREAPELFGRLLKVQAGGADAAPAVGGTLGTLAEGYKGGTAAAPARVPSFAGGAAKMSLPGSGGEIETRFVDALKAGGLTNPYGLAAMAAYAQHESRYAPKNITGSWSDPSESGQPGTSGGILSWRGDRFANMRRSTAGASDPVTAQAKFALTENPDLTLALQRAGSADEAHRLMADAWRFAGFNRPGGENAARLASTQAYVGRLGGGQGATRAAPAQLTSAAAPEADVPAQGAQPAGFQIPGQPAPAAQAPAAPQGFPGFGSPASRISAEQQAALSAAWRNPVTRPMATQIYGQLLKGRESQWDLNTMGDQPVLFNKATGQIVPVGEAKRNTATVGNTIVDTRTGQPIYQGEQDPKTATIGNALVDARTGQVIYQGPEKDGGAFTLAPGNVRFDASGRQIAAAPAAERDEGAKVREQVAAREAEGVRLGLTPGTPTAQTYALTGKIGRDQELSATDKKAIQEADEGVLSARNAIEALSQAKTLSKEAYSGMGAGTLGAVTSMFNNEAGVATEDLHNVVMTNALGQLRAIFGGNPTDGERKILVEMQGSVNKPDVVRQKIFDRGIGLAQKRLDFNQRRADDLRGGTYYKQEGGTASSLPRGEERVAIPDGKSAGAAIAEAKSVAKARPDLKPQLQERLRSWGIDPKRLED